MPRLTGRHVVAIVVAICCAVVLQPVASSAAGTLMTIVDRSNNTRQTRVTSNGGLVTENRPGAIAGQFTSSSSTTGHHWTFPVTTTGPTSIALTNVAIGNFADGYVRVLVQAYVRVSGTQSCASLSSTMTTTPAGWTAKPFGMFMIPANETLVLPLTQPWTATPPSGAPLCIGYKAVPTGGSGSASLITLHASITGYRYAA